MNSFRLRHRAIAAVGAVVLGCIALGASAAEDPVAEFEKEVRPLLEERCVKCHGADKQKGGLRLDTSTGVRNGGDSEEAAVVPGNSEKSPLIKRILASDAEEVMPPKGDRLKPEEIAALKRWIDRGAHWPAAQASNEPANEAPAATTTISDKDRAFWSFQPPRRRAPALSDDTSWSRQPIDRFILTRLRERGLEPSPEAPPAVLIRRMTFDLTGLPPTPEEVDTFIESSLNQPNSAVVKLADRLLASPRFGEQMASMWLPLARFAEDQAHQVGDDTKFFYPNAHLYRAWVIDAFNRDLPYDQFLKLQLAADRLPCATPDDLAALGFLGLGPKYYNRNRIEVMADEWEDRVDTVTRTMLGLTVACARCHDHKFDPISQRDYYALAGVFASTRMVNRMPNGSAEKDDAKAEKMNAATVHVVEDGDVKNVNLFIRGNAERKGPEVERGFIEVLSREPARKFTEGSGRRELAESIASPDNPLTARVFVNRVWGALFGRPLVPTPSNFGNSGSLPSHPELLDDLAARFVEDGWSMKKLVREMVLSATYRQSAESDTGKVGRDPGNESYWRMNRRRLSVEQWRDSVLAASGELMEATGAKSATVDDPGNLQRTVYSHVSRLKLNDLLMQFDYPDANVHAERRTVTTTPMQKLFVLNSAFMQRRATAFSARLLGAAEEDAVRISLAYRLLFAREPDETEAELGLKFVRGMTGSELSRWDQYAQLLLASNEMLYVD
jgi:mono/diheme cytochrome c family protein/cytochrome c553